MLQAAALIDQDLFRERTAAALGAAAAVASLDARFERAELLLQEALLLSPADDRLHNDQGVVLWSKARRDNSPVFLGKALERFGQALSLRAGNGEASRNRALLLREFGLAPESPQGVAEDDASVVWASERERLEQAISGADLSVAMKIVEAWPQATRLALEDGLIARTVEASPVAAAALSKVVDALATLQSDRLLADDLSAFERAAAKEPGASLAAHSAYAAGRALHLERKYGEAEEHFRLASAGFARAGSPMQFWARYYRAVGLFHRTRMDQADAEFQLLDEISRQRAYPILEAHVAWMEGLSASRQAQVEAGIGQWARAQSLFHRSREFENEASVAYLLGYAFAEAGDYPGAWRHQIVATQALPRFTLVRRKLACLDAAAFLLERMGLPRAAFEFQNAALSIAEESGQTLPTATTYRSRAETQLDLGRIDAASDDVRKARFHIAKLSEPEERADLESELDRIEARILRERGDALGALGRLEAAQEVVKVRGLRHFLVEIERERARALSSLGRFEESASLLAEMGKEWEARRSTYSDPTLRRRHQELGRSLLEDRVRAILAVETPDRAALSLAAVEGYRAKESRRSAATVDSVPARLAPKQVALEYLVLPEKTLRWRLDSHGVRLDELAVGQAALASAVATLRSALMSGVAEEEIEPLSRALHDLLVPADTGERLTLVPDGPLHELPFAALEDENGRYLVERSVIAIAPTLRPLQLSSAAAGADRNKLDVIAVSGDAFAADRFPALAPLAHAAEEAGAVAARWPRSEIITGSAATSEALCRAFCRARIVHVAAHGVRSIENAQETELLLAPSARNPGGRFRFADLPESAQCRPRLVVLSACNSGSGEASQAEGLLGAVHELRRRGVQEVLATLWPIPDEQAVSFIAGLFTDQSGTRDAAQLLAREQITLLRASPSSPSLWAAMQAWGF